ncbi:hypothetical protein AB1Y20_002995 [Prymnesium parvum]|uniref:Uncharacterized protein n=1 Tax=Prymnesium parvum TaxID=97485 RepID=A0AB34JCJ3_PRYPA
MARTTYAPSATAKKMVVVTSGRTVHGALSRPTPHQEVVAAHDWRRRCRTHSLSTTNTTPWYLTPKQSPARLKTAYPLTTRMSKQNRMARMSPWSTTAPQHPQPWAQRTRWSSIEQLDAINSPILEMRSRNEGGD